MHQSAQYQQVQTGDIDLSDNDYNLNPFVTLQDLCTITKQNTEQALLHPALLLERQKSYTVLAGAEFLPGPVSGKPSVTALVVDQATVKNHSDLLALLLRYRQVHSPLSLLEQAVFLQKAESLLPRREVINLLPLLGYTNKSFIIDELQELLKLDDSTGKAIHQGLIPLRCARKLTAFSPVEQKAITEIISDFQLGGSKQQKLIDFMTELTRRLQCSCRDLLAEWQETVKEKQLNGPQKAASLLNHLEELSHPRLRAAQEEFAEFCKTLRLPSSVKLQHVPAFENDRLTLSIDFASQRELAEYWPKIREILRPLKG